MQETWVQYPGQEEPLKEEVAAHSSTLAWRILWTEDPGGLQSMGSQRVENNWVTNTFTFFHTILCKGLEHLWIWVSWGVRGGPGTSTPGIL